MTATKSKKPPVPAELVGFLTICSECPSQATPLRVTADWVEDYIPSESKLIWFLRWLADYKRMSDRLFTGSRRYGTPKPDSDFDWVLRANHYTQNLLMENADEVCGKKETPDEDDYQPGRRATIQSVTQHHYDDLARLDVAVRFGPINVLLVSANPQWECWKEGTEQLVKEAPVTRERAVQVFTENWAAREEAWLAEATAQEEAMAEYEAEERRRVRNPRWRTSYVR